MLITLLAPLVVSVTAADSLFGNRYTDQHTWPLFIGLAVSAAITWKIGKWFNGKPGRLVQDVNTGRQMELKDRHDLFFIKFENWAIIAATLGFPLLAYFTFVK